VPQSITLGAAFSRYASVVRTSYNAQTGLSGTTAYSDYTGNVDYAWTKEKYWVRTPNFWSYKLYRAIPPDNPATWEFQDFHVAPVNVVRNVPTLDGSYTRYDVVFYSFEGQPLTTIPRPSVADDSELTSRLINKMRGQQWNAPIFVGELHKTTQLVYQRATHLAHLFMALRRGDLNRFFDGLKDAVGARRRAKAEVEFNRQFGRDAAVAVSNLYLEFRYGWVPFANDVRDAMLTIWDVLDYPAPQVFTVKAWYGKDYEVVGPEQGLINWENGLIDVRGRVRSHVVHVKRGVWRFKPRAMDIPAKFGLLNPFEVIWELVPFSFVADWFVPIGNYLRAWDASLRVDHVGGAYGQKIVVKATTEAHRCHSNDTTLHGGLGLGGRWTYVRREPITGVPTTSLLRMPLKLDLDAPKALAGIALLLQQTDELGRLAGGRLPGFAWQKH